MANAREMIFVVCFTVLVIICTPAFLIKFAVNVFPLSAYIIKEVYDENMAIKIFKGKIFELFCKYCSSTSSNKEVICFFYLNFSQKVQFTLLLN